MDSGHPIEGFPSVHIQVRYKNQKGGLWLSSLYGSYRGRQELEVPRGQEVEILCPFCDVVLSDGPECISCQAKTVILEMEKGGSVWFCSRYGCQKQSIAFGDLGKIVVASIMNRYIVSVYANDSLLTAAETLINYEISGVPVLGENETLVGLLTEEHILKLAYPASIGTAEKGSTSLESLTDWERVTCGDIVIPDPSCVGPEISLLEACDVMLKNRLNLLLVVKSGILVGVLSRGDLFRALLREKIG
jgi:CBS domain-containing protein